MEASPQSNFHIQNTSATKKIFSLRKRIRAISGGTAASKTISILIWLIDYCQTIQKRDKIVTVVSESYPHLDKGAMLDFETIMKDRGYWNDDRWNRTKHVYTFETNNRMEFYSVDNYGKAHGPRRDILFVNECNNLAYNIVDQLITRTREVVWLDWNPSSEFWFYTEMLGRREDLEFITLTYLDNEALDINTIQEIESHKHNKFWWQVYGLGQLGDLEGKIYKGWEILDDFPGFPHEARLWRFGLDFGYTNDPSAGVAVYEYNGGYILDEVLYQKGMSNKQIADLFINLDRALIVADSAEPKSIDEIKSYGLTIIPSVKGKDSVLSGIQFVQDSKIWVTKRSVNLLKEYRNYLWMTDRDGKIINEPGDVYNHCFVGETLVKTDRGDVEIESIKPGDRVLTTKGFKRVLKLHNNGKKRVFKYSLLFDTFSANLICTSDHRIKCGNEWKQISGLQSGDLIYLNKNLMEKPIGSIRKKDTAIKTARLVLLGREEVGKRTVYDLTVEDCHEYFANGVLAHNCMDALRYAIANGKKADWTPSDPGGVLPFYPTMPG